MKLSTTLAFGTLLVLSSAMPLEKRQDVTITSTIDVIETIEAIVTVWLPPGAKPALQDLHKQVAQPVQPNPAPAPHVTPVQDAVVPTSSSPPASSSPSAASQDSPQAAQDQVNNAQEQANHAQDLKNKAQKAQDLADQQQSIDKQNQINNAQDQTNNAKTAQNQAAPAPVAQPPAASVSAPAAPPVESSSAPAAPSATQDKTSSDQTQATSGGSCGEIGGSCTASDITYFQGGLGACGWTNDTTSEDFFAIAADMMGEESNGSPLCGRTAAIVYQGKTIHGTLTDKCPGCGGQSLDLSQHLFDQLFVESVGRYHDIEWHFTS